METKCKTCGGFGHDTPTCASKGGGQYSPPPGKGKGKGKDSPKGPGKGQGSQWGKGAWGKGKGKVSAFDDWPAPPGGAWDQRGQPPGLEPWMQAASTQAAWPPVQGPPWPGAQAQPPWPGATAPVRSLAGGFSSVSPAKPRAKLHLTPMPVATPVAPVPTRNRYDMLSEHIRPAASVTRVDTPEDYPITLFIKPTKLSKNTTGNMGVFGSTPAFSVSSATTASKDPETM